MLQLDEPLLSPQYSSHLSPFHRRESDGIWNGLETDLKRTWNGPGTDLERTWNGLEAKVERRINGGITAIESCCSLLHLEKQNFYTTRQLVTHSVVITCTSGNYTGNSFRCTRHPLITLT